MKTKSIISAIIVALFMLSPGVAAAAFGTQLGSYSNVPIYSNGTVSNYSGQRNYYNGYNTGTKWQCVEFISRFYFSVFGKKIAGGNANTFYSNAVSKGLNRRPNGGTDKPQVGNLLCSNGGSYGHCAIVRSVGSTSLQVIHQNWNNNTSDSAKTLSLTVSSSGGHNHYTVGQFGTGYSVVGWMW